MCLNCVSYLPQCKNIYAHFCYRSLLIGIYSTEIVDNKIFKDKLTRVEAYDTADRKRFHVVCSYEEGDEDIINQYYHLATSVSASFYLANDKAMSLVFWQKH